MQKKLLSIFIGIAMIMVGIQAKAEFPVTSIHKTVTLQQGWLNTSRPITAEELKGRIILLDFWTFCCINCIHVMPDLHYLEQKFGPDLTVIGVHSAKFANEKDTDNIRSAILRYGIEHAVVNDFDFKVWQGMNVHAWPTFILVNPRGQIEKVYTGEGHRAELEQDIAKLITANAGKLNNAPLPITLEKSKEPETYLQFPSKIAVGDGHLYISDSGHNRIIETTLDGKTTRVFEGFNKPQGVLYGNNALYVADTNNHQLKKIDLKTGAVSVLAGTGKQGNERRVSNGDALKTALSSPWDLAFYPDTNHIVIAMAGTHQLWTYAIDNGKVSVLAGNGQESIDDGAYPDNSLSQPSGLFTNGNTLYFVDSETSSLRALENGKITTLIGSGLFDFGFKDGKKGDALLQHPLGVFADESGVYISDSYNHSIRFYDVKTKSISTLIGDGKRGTLSEPNDIKKLGSTFYIADTNHHRIVEWDGKALKPLNITPLAQVSKPVNANTLPNLQSFKGLESAAVKAAKIQINTPKGWKINKQAPSWLTLYEKDTVKSSFDKAQLVTQNIPLPLLENGKTYLLQGTFYFCEDKEGALCEIQSISQYVKADAKATNALTLTLMPAGR